MSSTFLGVSIIYTTMTGGKVKITKSNHHKQEDLGKHFADGSHPAEVQPMEWGCVCVCFFAFTYCTEIRYLWTYPLLYYYGQILFSSSGKDLTAAKPQPPELARLAALLCLLLRHSITNRKASAFSTGHVCTEELC